MNNDRQSRTGSPAWIQQFLEAMLARPSFRIGQVVVHSNLMLHHCGDQRDDSALEIFRIWSDARKLALYDAEGRYRPLKSAPNLRRGWRLELGSVGELQLALDAFYPAAVGMWVAYRQPECGARTIAATPWRETLARQTGMYRVVAKISDIQATDLICAVCNQQDGCLRHILWELEPGRPHPLTAPDHARLLALERRGEIPILCREACNLLVAAGRPVVKSAQAESAESKA